MTREEYNKKPNICKYCKMPILCQDGQKVSYVNNKKYCSTKCYHLDKSVYNGSGIYCIKNQQNNKRYIGQSVNIADRIREHRSGLRNNRHHNIHLQNSWNEYGERSFTFEIIEKCNIDQLDECEQYWIKYYDTTNRDYGYNYETGGHINKKVSNETKIKISQNHHDVSGSNNPFFGKKHTEESVNKFLIHPNYIKRKHLGEDSHFAKLTLEQAIYIKQYLKEHTTTYLEEKELAIKFNVGISAIQKIKHNRTWKQIEV